MVSGISSTNSLDYWLRMQQAGSTGSNSTGMSADDIFAKLDTDGNGSLSQSEWKSGKPENQPASIANQVLSSQSGSTSSLVSMLQGLEQVLASLNSITGSDASDKTDTQGKPMSQEELLAKIDTDGNGSLSQSEFVAGRPSDMSESQATELYGKLDADGDGTISSAEFAKTGPQGAGPQGGPPPMDDNIFSKIDTNGDGVISKEELANDMASNAAGSGSTVSGSQSDISSLLTSLLQGTSEDSAAANSASTQSGTGNIASLLFQAASKYIQFTQGGQGLAGIASLAAMV